MPIINVPPNPPQPPNGMGVIQAKVTPAALKHSLIDTRLNPLSGILTHIDGLDFPVDYYSQFLGADEETENYAPDQYKPYQQYHLIEGYVLKLQGSLSNSVDPDNNAMTITGEAVTHPFFKPNIGDMLIADIGDGRIGKFTVTSSEKKTYFKQTVYAISIRLQEFINTQAQIDQLNSFVVKKSRYVHDFTVYGQNPVLADEEIGVLNDANTAYTDLSDYWFSAFYNHESSCIVIPDQVKLIYDPYLVKLMLDMIDINRQPFAKDLKLPNVDDHDIPKKISIWDSLVKQKPHLILQAFKAYGLLPKNRFHAHPIYGSVRYSKIDYVLVPIELQSIPTVGYNYFDPLITTVSQTIAVGFLNPSRTPTPATAPDGEDGFDIPRLGGNQVYVFSPQLYNGQVPPTKFEAMVQDYLNGDPVPIERVLSYVEVCFRWGRVEQFYFIPILLMLISSSIRRM